MTLKLSIVCQVNANVRVSLAMMTSLSALGLILPCIHEDLSGDLVYPTLRRYVEGRKLWTMNATDADGAGFSLQRGNDSAAQ